MDIKAFRRGQATQGKGHNPAPRPDEAALQRQSFGLVQCLDDRHRLLGEVLLSRVLPALRGPGPLHGHAFGHIVRANGLKQPVGELLIEAVDVVALGVELLARQVSQTVDIIDIVPAVPVALKVKPAGAGLLQPGLLLRRDAHQGQRLSAGCGILL